MLLPRADRGRDHLPNELKKVATVEQVTVYDQRDLVEGDPYVLDLINRGEVDYITLTSSNIARGLNRLVDQNGSQHIQNGRIKLVTISPQTSSTVSELGWPVAVEAKTYNLPGVVQAMLEDVGS